MPKTNTLEELKGDVMIWLAARGLLNNMMGRVIWKRIFNEEPGWQK